MAGLKMRSGGALAEGGPDGVGVKAGVEVKVGEGVTVGGGLTAGVEARTEVALLISRGVGGAAVGVAVGGMGLAEGAAVITPCSSPPPIGEEKEGAGACRSR